jgi:hypothetical protein
MKILDSLGVQETLEREQAKCNRRSRLEQANQAKPECKYAGLCNLSEVEDFIHSKVEDSDTLVNR